MGEELDADDEVTRSVIYEAIDFKGGSTRDISADSHKR